MIRFIIKKVHGGCDYPKKEDLLTVDMEIPNLEGLLRKGGYSQYGFEQYELIGVELLDSPDTPISPTAKSETGEG